MLHAALQGKISVNTRLSDDGLTDDGHVALMNEDSLTAIVFGLMTYLPGEVAWSLLQRSGTGLPAYKVGRLDQAEFWPAWSPQGTNTLRTEPDAYLRFIMGDPEVVIDIIVETKRAPKAHQKVEQWRDQIESYRDTILGEEAVRPDRAFYLAVSGLAKGKDKLLLSFNRPENLDPPVEIIFCEWTDLSNAARQLRDEGAGPTSRVMTMIMQGLAQGGFVERIYFNSFERPTRLEFQTRKVSTLA